MQRHRGRVVLLLAGLVGGGRVAGAQAVGAAVPLAPLAPAPTGSVTGHVTCSDTNGPARFASVVLRPVTPPGGMTRSRQGAPAELHEMLKVEQTGLDGSFTVAHVPPGDYYVVAEKVGYQSAGQISREQMDHPSEAVAKRMAALMTPVSVAANRLSTAEVRLLKGATLTGSVRFDDGSPDGAATVLLWGEDEKGVWSRLTTGITGGNYGMSSTDDAGHFRFSGLPAGEYLVSVEMEVETVTVDRVGGRTEGYSSRSGYELAVYAPSAMRTKEAKPVKLTDGQEEDGVELEVPLSKMHRVTGTLAEEGSGRRVNAGKVSLAYADDGTELASADVSGDDEAFHLAFVPEGEYMLKVTGAKEVMRTEVSNGPVGSVPPTHTEEKTVRSFGDASQPLVVTSEMSGVVVSVPPAKAAATP